MANLRICSKCSKVGLDQFDFYVRWRSSENKYYYKTECSECEKEANRKWDLANPGREKERKRKYAQAHPERVKESKRKWDLNNPDKCCDKSAKRRALKRNQTPLLTENEKAKVKLYYEVSDDLGPLWNVDHIIAIANGGPHHPDNLQVVTKKYNLEKKDKLNFRPPTSLEVRRI